MTTRPESAPDGAESLPGVIEIYAEYEATKAVAKAPGATREQLDAYDVACSSLRAARKYWREVKQAVYEQAVADWEASQVAVSPDAASMTLKAEEG